MNRCIYNLLLIVASIFMSQFVLRSQSFDGQAVAIDSAKVTASYSSDNRGNNFIYSPKQSLNTISIIGEPDVIRHISSLPGVAQGMDGTLGLFVRGAYNGGNRVEFNGVPISGTSHLLGLFSIFSPDIIASTSFSPGGISARYGDVSSSIVDIRTKKSSALSAKRSVSVSPYMTGAYISLSSSNGKFGVQAALRFSPALFAGKLIMKAVADDDNGNAGMSGNVYDVCILSDWNISRSNSVDLMLFASNDRFSFFNDEDKSYLGWNTFAVKGQWNSSLNEKLRLAMKLYYVSSKSNEGQIYYNRHHTKTSEIVLGNEKSSFAVQSELNWQLNDYLNINGGLMGDGKVFMPMNRQEQSSSFSAGSNQCYSLRTYSSFIDAFLSVRRLDVSLGLRNTLARNGSSLRDNFDLRFKVDYMLSDKFGVESTFDKFTQYHHILEGLPTGWALDIDVPVDDNFPEEVTKQGYVGVFNHNRFSGSELHLTMGAYYRKMNNLVSYKSSSNMFRLSDDTWEDEVDVGEGKSFGAELSASYTSDKFNGTLAYTLSKTTRRYLELNNGKEFPFKFDRRHILNIQAKYLVSKRRTGKGFRRKMYVNGVLAYSSGNMATVYASSYQGVPMPYWNQRLGVNSFPDEFTELNYNRYEMTSKNGWRMKDYFRIDVAYTIETHRKGGTSSLSFSIFNLLNRHNAYMIFNEGGKWKQLSIMPIMPSVRWSKEF